MNFAMNILTHLLGFLLFQQLVVSAASEALDVGFENILQSPIISQNILRDTDDEIIYLVGRQQHSRLVDIIKRSQLGMKQIAALIVEEEADAGTNNCTCKNKNITLDNRMPNETVPLTVFMFINQVSVLNSNAQAFASPRNTWIFQSKSYLDNVVPNLATNVYFLNHNQDESETEATDQVSLALYETFGLKRGKWRYTRRMEPSHLWIKDSSAMERRLNLHGAQIDVAHVKKPSILTNTGTETMNGFDWGADLISYQILGFMQDYLNFTIQFHNTSTWVYAQGEPADGVLYGGQALMVKEGEADLALSNTGLWPTKDFGFLYITRLYKDIFVYYHTTTASASSDLFVEVFPFNLVICVAALFLVAVLSTILFFKEMVPQEIMTWTVAMLSEQGPHEPEYRHQRSGRLFLLALLIFCILFYSSVSALLLAKLSFNEEISGVNALIKRGYKFGVVADSILDNGFNKMNQLKPNSPIYPVKKYVKAWPSQPEGAAEVVKNKRFAFVSHENWFLSFLNEILQLDICKNMRTMVIQDEKRWGTAFVHPNSEFRDHFNIARLYMAQVGLKVYYIKKLNQQTEDNKPSCYWRTSDSQKKSQSTLGGIYFQEVSLAFGSLGVGFILGFAAFLIEIVHNRMVMREPDYGYGKSILL